MDITLAFDLGAVAIKTVLLNQHGQPVEMLYEPLKCQPAEALRQILGQLIERHPELVSSELRVCTSGHPQPSLSELMPRQSEVVALARACQAIDPRLRGAMEIGGHTARWADLGVDAALNDFGLNQQCAAGAGVFLEQQAGRLQLEIEEFSTLAASARRAATIAGRCSVFAKSDMIHLQQKGTPVEEIAYGLCMAMARNFMATVLNGREIHTPMLFAGGGAKNPGLVKAFAEVFKLEKDDLIVSPYPGLEVALGAAHLAQEAPQAKRVVLPELLRSLEAIKPELESFDLVSLEPRPRFAEEEAPVPVDEGEPIYLGVDVGSVSTNLVAMTPDGQILKGVYLRTKGRPVEVVNTGLAQIGESLGKDRQVLGVGVTGSGRHLAAALLGADIVRNEITAQMTSTVSYYPDVDTIFEIGGQDSKYISVRDGSLRDFTMNKICAAGTGSFIEEQAEHLGVSVFDEFAQLATRAKAPSDLGCQCTVFMQSEVVSSQQRGTSTGEICAGLAYSIARNYLERVVEQREVGEFIVFQGGVASNEAVVAAFEALVGRRVYLHPHNKVSGAIGAAILARQEAPVRSAFRGFDSASQQQVKTFECKACSNRCQVSRITVNEQRVHFGDACEKFSSKDVRSDASFSQSEAPIERFRTLSREHMQAEGKKGVVGLPSSSVLLGQLPFWSAFFNSLGYGVVTSGGSTPKLFERGLRKLPAETCLPVKLAIGHTMAMGDAKPDFVFMPSINFLASPDKPEQSATCPYVEALPYMVRAALDTPILTPELDFSRGERAFLFGMREVMKKLRVTEDELTRAYRAAMAAQRRTEARLAEFGSTFISNGDGPKYVVIGKPYNLHDPFLNLNLFHHLRALGMSAIPMEMLPPSDEPLDPLSDSLLWRNNRSILRALRSAKANGLYPILVSNFGCGPDAFTNNHIEPLLHGEHALFLEFDEHRGEAGLVTRLEAFRDEVNNSSLHQPHERVARPEPAKINLSTPKTIFVPYFADHAYAFSGALMAAGHTVKVLPPTTPEMVALGEKHTSGKECHPFTMTAGDLLAAAKQERRGGELFFFPGTVIPCLLHQYGHGHDAILRRAGITDMKVITPSAEEQLELLGIEKLARLWQGLVAVDLLTKAACETRPYELEKGMTDELHQQNIKGLEDALIANEVSAFLKMAAARIRKVPTRRLGSKPLVGVAGDIYTRVNHVANENLFHWLEEQGLEVWPSPFMVDIVNFTWRREIGQAIRHREFTAAAVSSMLMLRKVFESWRVERQLRTVIERLNEPDYNENLELAKPYVGEETNGALLLNVTKMVDFARRGADGVVNAASSNCMIGTVSAAISQKIKRDFGGLPIANLFYNGVRGSQQASLEAFVHQVHHRAQMRRGRAMRMRA